MEYIRTPVGPPMAMTELFTTKCMLTQDLTEGSMFLKF
jgi:hypothetical protein